MLELTPDQFKRKIEQNHRALNQLLEKKLPEIIGRMAVKRFKENFQNESFGRKHWKEVKRRQSTWQRGGKEIKNPIKGAAKTRKILTGSTGDLGRSIDYDTSKGKVTISSDLIYAAVHNYGLRAGRGKGFVMPQRQFIGDDPELLKDIKNEIEKEINIILK